MKNRLIAGAILICLLIAVTGCAKAENSETEIPGEIISGEINDTKRPNILELAVPLDDAEAVAYIPNSVIEENLMQDIMLFQDMLLCSYYTYDADTGTDTLHLRLLSLDSGEMLSETQLKIVGVYTTMIQVCGSNIIVSDAQGGLIHVLDAELNETKSYTVQGNIIYVDTTATQAYCLTRDNGVHILNLENGEERIIFEDTQDLSFYSFTGNCISIRYVDLLTADKRECYAGINLETGEIEKFEFDDSFSGMEYSAGIWLGELLSRNSTYFIGTQDEPRRFEFDAEYPYIQLVGDPAHIIITSTDTNGKQTMSAFRIDGTFLAGSSLSNAGGVFTNNLLWIEDAGGYLLTVIDETGYDKLCFWDLSTEMPGSNLELKPYYEEVLTGEILDKQYYERAAALSEEYGVTVKIADQCSTDYVDKSVVQEHEVRKIDIALSTLEDAFSKYPDGFFEQLRYGAFRTLEINLMGTISNKEEIEGHMPNAFVQHENGVITMVLNINVSAESLKQNFYHESSHIIDKVLEHNAQYRGDALFSEEKWSELNPESFISLNPENGGYYGSYEIMPLEYYQEGFTPYFAFDYGKSFATEDRATIFELAMTDAYQRFTSDAAYPLQVKLRYYCQCIRDCFDTTGWSECTAWEAVLSGVQQV